MLNVQAKIYSYIVRYRVLVRTAKLLLVRNAVKSLSTKLSCMNEKVQVCLNNRMRNAWCVKVFSKNKHWTVVFFTTLAASKANANKTHD